MIRIVTVLAILSGAHGFTLSQSATKFSQRQSSFLGATVKTKERTTTEEVVEDVHSESFLAPDYSSSAEHSSNGGQADGNLIRLASLGAMTALTAMALLSEDAHALISMPKELTLSSGSFDPNSFVPVCPASDGLYRILQGSAKTIVGPESFQEYGPLIASGLLRVRLELCVVESFFNEAVGPFIRQNGISWVLPLHETVETFLAGSVFALATTFILVGSTKILTVILTYADFLIGAPLRFFGGYTFDRARGKPITLDIGFGPFKQRLIGPKDDGTTAKGDDEWTVDFSDTGPGDIAAIFLSGTVKFLGTIIKVRTRHAHKWPCVAVHSSM